MYRQRPSYIASAPLRQPLRQPQSPPFRRLAAILLLALATAGCAGLGLPFGERRGDVTGSVVASEQPAAANVAASDWETVRQALSGMAAGAGRTADADWRNPATGSAGTITAFAPQEKAGALCRAFATTVNDTRGIRRYRGEACRSGGEWRLTGVAPEDGKLR